jgi:glycosyltransferase involved in cell wall biosynthesis
VVLRGRDHKQTRADIEALVGAAGLSGQISALPSVEGSQAKKAFLSAAAVFVQPSRWEAEGIALLEALAIGVPAVVTETCAISSLLATRDAAVIVEAEPAAIAAGVRLALARGPELSANGQRLFEEDLCWDHVASAFLDKVTALLDHPA